ncbi:hypothetical protein, partial [Alloalcanivorax xenomutans]|uniref:hypothetical protein n=1 Tax=Alloalcanivorax xenomutans TaxID=1094342 RepID=UPI001C53C576
MRVLRKAVTEIKEAASGTGSGLFDWKNKKADYCGSANGLCVIATPLSFHWSGPKKVDTFIDEEGVCNFAASVGLVTRSNA